MSPCPEEKGKALLSVDLLTHSNLIWKHSLFLPQSPSVIVFQGLISCCTLARESMFVEEAELCPGIEPKDTHCWKKPSFCSTLHLIGTVCWVFWVMHKCAWPELQMMNCLLKVTLDCLFLPEKSPSVAAKFSVRVKSWLFFFFHHSWQWRHQLHVLENCLRIGRCDVSMPRQP